TGTAMFGASSQTTISFSVPFGTSIGTMQLNSDSPAYTFMANGDLEVTDKGIVNNSGLAPVFVNARTIFFRNASTAANATITNTTGGETLFSNASSAGNATITNTTGGE